MDFFPFFRHQYLQGKMFHIRKIQNILFSLRLSELFFKSCRQLNQHLYWASDISDHFQKFFLCTLEISLPQFLQNPLFLIPEIFHSLLLLFIYIRSLLCAQPGK